MNKKKALIWLVDKEFIHNIVLKYSLKQPFTKDEKIDCCYIENGKFIVCYNSTGDAFMEEYGSYIDMLKDNDVLMIYKKRDE